MHPSADLKGGSVGVPTGRVGGTRDGGGVLAVLPAVVRSLGSCRPVGVGLGLQGKGRVRLKGNHLGTPAFYKDRESSLFQLHVEIPQLALLCSCRPMCVPRT